LEVRVLRLGSRWADRSRPIASESYATEKGHSNSSEMTSFDDLPMWPSGQSTWAPCAVERDALSGRGSTGPGGVHLLKNYSYAHDEQGYNPGQDKEGSTVSYINCDRC